MRIGKLILICLLIIRCSSNELVDNQKTRDSIDELEISKIITEVETDSIGNIIDTISIEYLKYDDQNRKRFKKKIYWYGDRKSSLVDYFKSDEDLFYRKSFDAEGKTTLIFETKLNSKGRVEKGIQISLEREPHDTIIMDYSHQFHSNGKVKKLLITTLHKEIGEINSKVEYDEYEKPLLEVVLMKDDTMSFQRWEYVDTTLQRSIYTNYQGDTSKIIYHFRNEKMLINEEGFYFTDGKFIKSKEVNHFYNKENEKTKSTKRNIESKKVKYIKYLIER